ncbi:methionyl-tRNA formyltransferase [Erysipelothrix inopinata]|uniref:Methionyl-tRNA formyltransferase n=1 Tax=Erysipelothrix inopinata TaxID=225084 RepID=A0A7G9RYG3_9FIRM|nr:methionyl-tRNA formyltransferase [Erysipelothrix inopinata]QNN60638.1 methionyl-tRNA formyltransferase [Erysipelothrix inopinata]
MRVIFMGTTPFSCVILQQLLDDGYDVVAVVTQPDRPFGRKKILKASSVKELALKNEIDVLQPVKIRTDFEEVLSYKPDLIITCAYGQIVPKVILDYPQFGCLNVHASLLPKFRGGAPIHWSIIRGEKETGVTLMHMDVGMDSGDMLAFQNVPIDEDDTMGHVEAKLMEVSKILIHEDLKDYLDGKLERQKQNDEAVTLAYTIQRDDEYISFNRNVDEVYNHIRGLIPWPVGYGVVEGQTIKLHGASKIMKDHQHELGKIVSVEPDGMMVAAEGGYIVLTRIQLSGKPAMDIKDFANGVGRDWEGKMFE